MKAKFVVLLVALLVFSLSVTGLAFDPETFVFVSGAGSPLTLDPARSYDTASGEAIHQLYDNLFTYVDGDMGNIGALLATEVPTVANGLMSEDGLTIRVPVRKEVKFHNGDILTPEDVQYSILRAMLADPDGGPNWMFFEPLLDMQNVRDVIEACGGTPADAEELDEDFEFDIKNEDPEVLLAAYEMIASTIEVDGDDVVFHLAMPYPPFINILTKGGSWAAIVNKKWMIANGAWDGTAENWANWYNRALEEMTLYDQACGTGPFTLEAWDKSGNQLIFSRFDDYFRGPAKIKTAYIKSIHELSTRLLMLRAGDADGVYVDIMDLDQARPLPGVTVVEGLPQLTNATLFFSFTIPVEGNEDFVFSGKLDGKGIPSDFFTDVDVRKGFAYAFDYQAFLDECVQGAGEIPKGPIPQSLPYVNLDQEYYTHNLDQAAEHFQKAWGGEVWDKGFEIGIVYNIGNDMRKTALEILEFNLKAINPKFKIHVIGIEWATMLDKLASSDLPVFVMGWLADFPDTHNFAVPYYHSTGTFLGFCGRALIDLAKAEFDELVEAGIKATDPVERERIYHELQKRYVEQAIAVPLMETTSHRVMQDWVKGFVYCPAYSANFDFWEVYKEQ